jgi:hypothetical protein
MMTKQEEREALAKIQKIIKAAGPDSYIGMAFAGCCEIAADNIENDFGNSPQAKIAALEAELKEEKQRYYYLQKEHESRELVIDRLERKKGALQEQLTAAKAQILPPDLYKLVWLAIDDHVEQAQHRIEGCVDILVKFADNPNDIAVSEALKRIKEAAAKKDKYSELLDQFDAYEPKED